ncbi:MAG: hypothetical protein ABEJ91_04290 [Candidatus Nanohaloarchaea archaeon]
MTFLLDSLKEKLGSDDSRGGFGDLNYQVGNTSGMDIGQVPGPLDQRIGRMAQIGGSIMEIQITNPATFQIDRPELMNVIDQLGFDDVTLHGDPNIGFTGAYATRGQGVTGYNIVHRYFKRYLEQMASFREEALQEEKFDVGYVNMHASNEQIPPREEQIASDKSLDPFGMRLTEINGDKEPNIYRNEEFMRLLFDFLLEEQIERYELFQLYTFFENYCPYFRDRWLEARNTIANQEYRERTDGLGDKARLASTAVQVDQGANQSFAERMSELDLPEDIQQMAPGSLRNLPEALPRFLNMIAERDDVDGEAVREHIEGAVDDIWNNDVENGFSYEAKAQGLVNHEDLERRDIESPAAKETVKGKKVRYWARETFAGSEEVYTEEELEGKPNNLELFERLTKQTVLGRQMEKESTAFFNVMPAWMMTASEEADNHRGWNVPEFIWRNIVVENSDYSEKELKDYEQFQEFLDEDRENQLNVIAAVGACYLWGHFTQREDSFNTEAFEQTVRITDEYEQPEFDGSEVDMTWIEWMNRFGIKVNIEAMFGSPGELRRLWRPRDIAVACHAINMEADQQLEGYDQNLVKFTIDMEHTASYGVDPLQELKKLIENEKRMAGDESQLDIDPDRPLAEIVKTYHLTKPGWEQQSGHRHGPFTRGDKTLYTWLYRLVENGFARNPGDEARIIFEVGGEYREEMYVIRVAMDMIELGIKPEDLDPNDIPVDGEFETTEQELKARFFGMDRGNFNREWAKIEEHAFDPLDGLLETEGFDNTYSGSGAIEQGGARPNEWKQEEHK